MRKSNYTFRLFNYLLLAGVTGVALLPLVLSTILFFFVIAALGATAGFW